MSVKCYFSTARHFRTVLIKLCSVYDTDRCLLTDLLPEKWAFVLKIRLIKLLHVTTQPISCETSCIEIWRPPCQPGSSCTPRSSDSSDDSASIRRIFEEKTGHQRGLSPPDFEVCTCALVNECRVWLFSLWCMDLCSILRFQVNWYL